jgi:serine/threonine protein phosphatase PrpC
MRTTSPACGPATAAPICCATSALARSRDHSLVQSLVDGGDVAEADRRNHPNAHVITRAVGAGPALELDRCFTSMRADDIFLLCSDGLTACFEDDELAGLLEDDLDVVADVLLAQSLARGAPDNISFVLIQALDRTERASAAW